MEQLIEIKDTNYSAREEKERGDKWECQEKKNCFQKEVKKRHRIEPPIIDSKKSLEKKENMENYLKDNLENLELLDYMDSGSESVVYSVNLLNKKNTKMKKKLTMKLILHHKRENKHEIFISSKLKNINIINFYAYSKVNNESSMILLEMAKYGHLRNFQKTILKRQILSETLICFFASQILNGIAYCHRCRVSHNDIKLQNIVVDEYLNLKLIDFSISTNYKKLENEDVIKLACMGTNFYMSKEVIKSEEIKVKDLNKIDLYAFGVVLYNLGFGKYPYGLKHGDEDNYETILYKIENEKLDLKNDMDFSPSFLDFISKLLKKDINERISINEALQHSWIKGSSLLLEEKEKTANAGIFLSYLITDQIKAFNDYVHHQN